MWSTSLSDLVNEISTCRNTKFRFLLQGKKSNNPAIAYIITKLTKAYTKKT